MEPDTEDILRLLDRYTLEEILEINDISPEALISLLLTEGWITLEND